MSVGDYMLSKGFMQVKKVSMWEMLLIVFIRLDMQHRLEGNVNSGFKRCGFGNIIGNKGGVNINFRYASRDFFFVGCHLVHG
jgi:hypothetical protein